MLVSKNLAFQPVWLPCALSLLVATCHAATVEKTTYNGLEAYRLSDEKTEAVIVPSLSGRVMRYGAVGGANWLWNAAPEKLQAILR